MDHLPPKVYWLKRNRCVNEERLCFDNNDLGGSFQTGLAAWHNVCDSSTTAAITTPPLSSITVSEKLDFCVTAFSSCDGFSVSVDQCSLSYSGQNFFSCLCQPKILSLEYTCEFLGNTSCQLSSAALTNLELYPYCSNLVSVLGTGNNVTVGLPWIFFPLIIYMWQMLMTTRQPQSAFRQL
jgi:hypothetical protein